jgi:hypothetical protein
MEGDREEIAALIAPLQEFVPCLVIGLFYGKRVFRIVNLLDEILIYPGFDVEYEIARHRPDSQDCPLWRTRKRMSNYEWPGMGGPRVTTPVE